MKTNDKKPQIGEFIFTCPHCGNTCLQKWRHGIFEEDKQAKDIENSTPLIHDYDSTNEEKNLFRISRCTTCGGKTVWLDGEMLYPDVYAPKPEENMPSSVLSVYKEAASVLKKSPRCSCALLRLALENLCSELKVNGKNLDDKIKTLCTNGLPKIVQEALDVVRVIGNKAIHAGEISIDYDNYDNAITLFEIVNFIVDRLITTNNKIEGLYQKLPESVKNAIDKRNRHENQL